MNKQRGYINIDLKNTFTNIALIAALVGVIVGAILGYGVPWLWSIIKPLIHALTA